MERSSLRELCSVCKHILSVPPIFIEVDGKNICGRCKIDCNNSAKYMRNVFYEELASHYCFPCRFAEEGCTSKEEFNKMKRHEKVCLYQTIQCDIKQCEWSGMLFDFILHCLNRHRSIVIDMNVIKELEGKAGKYIVNKNGFLFLITWMRSSLNLVFKCRSLQALLLKEDPAFDFNLFLRSTAVSKKLSNVKINTSSEVVFNLEEDYKDLSISLTTNLPFIESDYVEKITCPNCKCQMVPPILKCSFGHITCVDCTTFGYDYCKSCDVYLLKFKRVLELEAITLVMMYSCKSCSKQFNVHNIKLHEQYCSKRTFECQHCFEWDGLLNDIIPHHEICLSKYYTCKLLLDTQVTHLGKDITSDYKNMEYWLIAYNDYFSVDFEIDDIGIDIIVSYYGLPSLFGWYSCKVDLMHVEGVNCELNKTYHAIYKDCSSLLVVDIPNADLEKFGGKEFCKFVVQIILIQENDERGIVAKPRVEFSIK